MNLELQILPETLAVCRLEPRAAVPPWALTDAALTAITRTDAELSIVCPEAAVPGGVRCEKGWRCFKILGPLPFAMTGVPASLVDPLAQAGISVFAFSTYDTDFVMVKADRLEDARQALTLAGFEVRPGHHS